MKQEIYAAVAFILKLIEQNSSNLNEEQLQKFAKNLCEQLYKKFVNHWHPGKPWQGQGYRCLRVNETNGEESTIAKAAQDSGIKYSDLKLPLELTVWVDPNEVCCRFGEHKGSYCTIASFQNGNTEEYINKINFTELLASNKENLYEDCLQEKRSKEVTKPESLKSFPSLKENLAPNNIDHAISSSISNPVQTSTIMKSLMNSTLVNSQSALLHNKISPPIIYSSQLPIQDSHQNTELVFTPNENYTLYKRALWGIASAPQVNSHQSLYSSTDSFIPISSQANFNTYSPINTTRLRWNSGSILNSDISINDRTGWLYQRQLIGV